MWLSSEALWPCVLEWFHVIRVVVIVATCLDTILQNELFFQRWLSNCDTIVQKTCDSPQRPCCHVAFYGLISPCILISSEPFDVISVVLIVAIYLSWYHLTKWNEHFLEVDYQIDQDMLLWLVALCLDITLTKWFGVIRVVIILWQCWL